MDERDELCEQAAPRQQYSLHSEVCYKRLEEDRFVWPRRQQAVMELTTEQLHWLLEGIDIDAVRRHPARQYRHAG
jgi:transposase